MSFPRRNVLGAAALLMLCAVLGTRLWHRHAAESNGPLARLAATHPAATAPGGVTPAAKPSNRIVTVPLAPGVPPKFADARFTNRLRNTAATANELVRQDRAILLRNAFVDTASGEPLQVPAKLRAEGDPGAYLVQAVGGITAKFRQELEAAGAHIVSYIPNSSFLVLADADTAERLNALPDARTLAYEPYFKLEPDLLVLALADTVSEATLKLILTLPDPAAALPKITALGGTEVFRERGPFGTLVTVELPGSALVPLARLAEVPLIERWRPVTLANDRTGYLLGSTVDPQNITPFSIGGLPLTGDGVQINLNDSGVDATHPDLAGRVFSVDNAFLRDTNGHGTHVAGILAGNGSQSASLAVPPQGSLIDANFQGRASGAELYVLPVDLLQGPPSGDAYLQETAAGNPRRVPPLSAPLISNNSWGYGSTEYSTHSASFDAAVRDALPTQTGYQPMLYVFSAGNSGFGGDNGLGGDFDSVNSPGNAKNVITVGALESGRNLTNAIVTMYTNTNTIHPIVIVTVGSTIRRPDLWPDQLTNVAFTYRTNIPYAGLTDSDHQVASYSSRGNVGIGSEGDSGRFKPDVAVPGTFIVSTRSAQWQLENDFPLPFYQTEFELFKDLTAETQPAYRYESGTSMAAPAVAGLLAQMQEYFQKQPPSVHRPSAAGYKALLLNSAVPTSPAYYPDPKTDGNYTGWGQPDLTRALSSQLMRGDQPLFLIESDEILGQPVGLATGESRSYTLTLGTNVTSAALRLTLVWTDPPGNPVGAAKLVNDLDLVVSNTVTGEVIYGNDFEPGFGNNLIQKTNDITRFDRINNVERIVLPGSENSTNLSYVITVIAHRVNVNARGDHPNAIVQDYALAIATDAVLDDGLTVAGEVAAGPALSLPGMGLPPVLGSTNGGAFFNQRVGENSPLINGRPGQTNQWQFYTFTNAPFTNLNVYSITNDAGGAPVTNFLKNGSNVAFVTFPYGGQGNLSLVRSNESDIDLYVSRDPALLNLDPDALKASFKSTGRGATELVFFTNSEVKGEIYYVGVKSEDHQAAEFGFVGISTDQPFTTFDNLGFAHVLTVPIQQPIRDGTPDRPGLGLYLAISTLPGEIRGVTPKVFTQGQNFLDLLGNLTHDRHFAVLNNHGQLLRKNFGAVTVTYEDTGSGQPPGSVPTDGPGSLINFLGGSGTGPWFLATSDNALGNTNRINYLDLGLLPNDFGETFVSRCVSGGRISLEVINIPADASKLTVTVTNMSPALPLQVFIKRDELPDITDPANNDKFATIRPPGGDITLSDRDIPALQPGRYFVAVYNPNPVQVCYRIRGHLDRDLSGNRIRTFTSSDSVSLTDLAMTLGRITVDDVRPVASVQVGVRLDHPRESDLAIRLINPVGAQVLLAEDRGLVNGQGYGKEVVTTNGDFAHVAFTYERASGKAVLYVNGNSVAEGVFRSYVAPTTNAFFFGVDPTKTAAEAPGIKLDDFGVWRRPLRPSEVGDIYRYGLDGYGKDVSDAGRGLVALWPFDTDAVDLISTNMAVFSGAQFLPGEISAALVDASGLGGRVEPSKSLDLGAGPGISVEGWVAIGTAPSRVAIAGWGDTNGVSGPVLMANLPPPLGNGPGSVSVLFNQDGSKALLSPPNVATKGALNTNTFYAVFTDLTNRTASMIKFAEPPFFTDTRTRLLGRSEFDTNAVGFYFAKQVIDGWTVTNGVVQALQDPDVALTGSGYISLQTGSILRTFGTIPGRFYTISFASRRTPNSLPGSSGTELFTNDVSVAMLPSTNLWQTNEFTFQVFSKTYSVELRELPGHKASTLIDSIRFVEEPIGLYLPEEPLKPANAVSGAGDWQLAVTDSRSGQSGLLKSWQLTLTFAPTNPPAVNLSNGVPYVTNVVNGETKYFIVDVPPEATSATNYLESLSGGSLNLYFNQSGIPDGLQPEDYWLLKGVIAEDHYTLTTNLVPVLQPGQRYYLGVQNVNPGDTTLFRIRVDFALNIIPLTNNVPYAGTNANIGFIDYYSFDVTNAVLGLRFAVTNFGSDVNLVARRAPLLPTRTTYDYTSVNVGSAPEEIRIFPSDPTNVLAPGKWLLGVYVADPNSTLPASYTITASEIPLPIALTNQVSLTATFSNRTDTAYYYFDVTNDVTLITFALTNLSQNVDLFVRQGFPIPTPTDFDYASTNKAKADELIQVRSFDPAFPLPQGRWFLEVVPVGALPASYTIVVKTGEDSVQVTDLQDKVPLTVSHQPGDPSQYFRFLAPPDTSGLLFEIYDLTGEADLYLAKDVLPAQAVVVYSDLKPGTTPELNVLRTNSSTPDISGTYYLEVRFPATATNQVDYTIRAATSFGGLLESGQPLVAIFLPRTVPGDPIHLQFNSVPGESYQFEYTDDIFADFVEWTPVPPAFVATGTVTTADLPVAPSSNTPGRYYHIVQVPAP